MSMTRVNARLYVARVLGGGSSQETIDAADEAILRAFSDWEDKKFWVFLRKDTSQATAVTGLTATGASAVVAAVSNNLNFVNVGQGVTIAAGTATLAAGTTVLSFTRDSSGNIATITLSNSFGGTTNANATLTFSANIPIIIGTNEYNLPMDYNVGANAKFITTLKTQVLTWRDQEYWDRVSPDESLTGTPQEFTTYNPVSELTQNFGDTRLRFDRIPTATDTMLLRYYRKFNTTGTNVDMPDNVLYKFLDYCRSLCLEAKRAKDDPGGFRDSALDGMEQAAESDEQQNTEDDVNECIKSQYEAPGLGPLWRNGDFDQYR